jgi:hypothetical protein
MKYCSGSFAVSRLWCARPLTDSRGQGSMSARDGTPEAWIQHTKEEPYAAHFWLVATKSSELVPSEFVCS